LPGEVRLGKKLPDIIKSADIDGRIGTRGFTENRLIHQFDAV